MKKGYFLFSTHFKKGVKKKSAVIILTAASKKLIEGKLRNVFL